ncbi:hypothetical protein HID58_079575 [Brassica napus]|uniref:Ribosomal protein L15 n=1 Tax=Brassica napus TaxID=3708 RepID=A0ABQ7Y3Q9_BRANA|nr:hypothetical protein HID58_079575 [Brassica napus]
MEIVLLVNVCSVYLKAWSWDRSKKIITSILKSEAAHSFKCGARGRMGYHRRRRAKARGLTSLHYYLTNSP